MEYLIRRAPAKPELRGLWDGPAWQAADVAEVASFHLQSSPDHHPHTQAKMLHDADGLYVHFRVRDRYVVCAKTENQSLTCKDSCVEVYLQPFPNKGYLNFEINCGGTLLLFYVIDSTRSPAGIFRHKLIVPQSLIETMRIYHSMPKTLEKEIAEPTEWSVEFFVPYALIETYVGELPPPEQRTWRGNFHKCADDSSHPHWASWSPIGEPLNFHRPETFGTFRFLP
jgi:hypothetical protein